jgi:hypothetical protein
MSHEKLKHMKDTLMCVVEMQLCELDEVDTKELGEAIDMIKDLEEAIYYATVTEAMHNSNYEVEWEMEKGDRQEKEKHGDRMYYGYPRMYYADDKRGHHPNDTWKMDEGNWPTGRDEREGRSPMSRKMYMEAKEDHKDKATQLRELEKYMQELTQDITDMIADSSAEEKQYLEKKITALATKIGQMK